MRHIILRVTGGQKAPGADASSAFLCSLREAVEHRGRNVVTLYRRVAPWSWRPDTIGHSGADTRFGLEGWGPITQQRKPDPVTVRYS